MKFLRIFLFIVLAVLAAYIVFCFIGPKSFDTTRSVTVGASPASVFEEISDFHKWPAWSPWARRDTAMVNTYNGEPGTVGHINEWESKTEGNGNQKITEVRSNEFIRTELRFKDWDGVSVSDWMLEPAGDSTKVTWTMDGDELPFFIRGLMFLMGGGDMISKDYETGLASLKKVAEAKPKGINYEIVEIPDTWYIGKRMMINLKDLDSTVFGKTYGELFAAIGGPQNIAGMPFSIGHMVNMETGDMDIEIALPIAASMTAPKGLNVVMIPAGRCIKHVYYGAYDATGPVWEELMNVTMDKYTTRWSGYEVYANDPAEVKSEAEYITWLMQPVN